jgi:hypothetical protein
VQPRPSGLNYPLLVGLIALISLIILWNLPDRDLPLVLPTAVDAGPAPVPDAGPPEAAVPVLAWQVEGATLPTQGALTDCLRSGGWDRIRVLGGGARPLSVTHGTTTLAVVPQATGLEVRTPLLGGRHLAVGLHGAVARCVDGRALVDAVTGRHADPSTWPTARRDAGLPLPLLVKTVAGPGYLASQGLERLGLFDVLVVGADTPRLRRVLERAAVAVLLADDPAASSLVLGERTVVLSGPEVGWWPVGASRSLRGLGDAARAFEPPPQELPEAVDPKRPPAERPPAERPPAERPPAERPGQPPTVPRRALPTTPLFKPEYR